MPKRIQLCLLRARGAAIPARYIRQNWLPDYSHPVNHCKPHAWQETAIVSKRRNVAELGQGGGVAGFSRAAGPY